MQYLEEIKDYAGIIETSRNRREPWGKKTLAHIIFNVENPLDIRKKAVEAIVNSPSLNKASIYSRILKSVDESILQVFLKQVDFKENTKIQQTLNNMITNQSLSVTTRLLAAKLIKNNKTDLIKLMTK